MGKTDSEVYEQLVKEKSKVYKTIIIVLVILLFLFIIATTVLAVLYTEHAAIAKELEINVETQGGDLSESLINSNGSTVNGNIQVKDNTAIIIVAIICVTVIIIGGTICLLYFMIKSR